MKKYIFATLIVFIAVSVFIFVQRQQPPTKEDVYHSTENWSPQITNVYMVKKINGDWMTFFRSDKTFFVGRLQQNWLGLWHLGKQGALGSAYLNLNKNKGVAWSISGITYPDQRKIAFYSGIISNPQVKRIAIETEDETFKDVPLFQAEGLERFFFLKTNGEPVPVSIKAFSEKGDLILEYD